MSENVKAFLEAAKADPELRERLPKMTAEEIVAAAKEMGIELTDEDFRPAAGELGEGELSNVAGGVLHYGMYFAEDCVCFTTGIGADPAEYYGY